MADSPFCALHANPRRAAELGSIGGRKNRHYVESADVTIAPPSTPEEVKNLLSQTMADVHSGKLHPRIAHALTYLAGTLLRAMEGTELQHRLACIEAQLRNPGGHGEQGNASEPLMQSEAPNPSGP